MCDTYIQSKTKKNKMYYLRVVKVLTSNREPPLYFEKYNYELYWISYQKTLLLRGCFLVNSKRFVYQIFFFSVLLRPNIFLLKSFLIFPQFSFSFSTMSGCYNDGKKEKKLYMMQRDIHSLMQVQVYNGMNLYRMTILI